jgi:putative tryptophan/tyrosine transport system substrate-binding protein
VSRFLGANLMTAKCFGLLLAIFLLVACSIVEAQQSGKVSRIGIMVVPSRSFQSPRIEAFRQGLRELGYVEEKNVIIEYRYAEGQLDLLPALTSQLVQLKPEVIVTTSTPGVLAAKNATQTIPVVFAAIGDPVATGLVASLARPGGNVTGLTILSPEVSGKRLELLKEAFPKVARVMVFWSPTDPGGGSRSFKETEAAAKALGVQLQSVAVLGASDFESGFERAKKEDAQALVAMPNPIVHSNQKQIVDFAAKNRLPAMYAAPEIVDAGGLMSYGPNEVDLWRRAAIYVDKILKGTRPSDLPVERPTKFEFVINLKTAKQLGLTISPNVMARADRIIR